MVNLAILTVANLCFFLHISRKKVYHTSTTLLPHKSFTTEHCSTFATPLPQVYHGKGLPQPLPQCLPQLLHYFEGRKNAHFVTTRFPQGLPQNGGWYLRKMQRLWFPSVRHCGFRGLLGAFRFHPIGVRVCVHVYVCVCVFVSLCLFVSVCVWGRLCKFIHERVGIEGENRFGQEHFRTQSRKHDQNYRKM